MIMLIVSGTSRATHLVEFRSTSRTSQQNLPMTMWRYFDLFDTFHCSRCTFKFLKNFIRSGKDGTVRVKCWHGRWVALSDLSTWTRSRPVNWPSTFIRTFQTRPPDSGRTSVRRPARSTSSPNRMELSRRRDTQTTTRTRWTASGCSSHLRELEFDWASVNSIPRPVTISFK